MSTSASPNSAASPAHAGPDQATLVRLVRQHARTAQLMGADCVPVYRMQLDADAASDLSHEMAANLAAPQSSPPVPQARIGPPPVAQAMRVAPVAAQPAARAAASSATPSPLTTSPTPRVSAAKQAASAWSFEPPTRLATEGERAYRERALLALRERYESDAPHTQFVTAFTNLVWGDGDPTAAVCFVGEAPGEEEDKQGKPFVGRSGELLGKMIVAMGLSRESVYICNVLKTRPPDNATPTTREIDICRPYLLAQLAIVRPRAIVTLGLPASRAVLRSEETMARLRGNWASLSLPVSDGTTLSIPVMPTYHPAYLLRSYTPENRAKVWSDLCLVLEKLGLALPASTEGKSAEGKSGPSKGSAGGAT